MSQCAGKAFWILELWQLADKAFLNSELSQWARGLLDLEVSQSVGKASLNP